MTRVYLVRHCRTSGQAPDAPLTAEGETQAILLADFLAPLGIDRVVSSPFTRAIGSIAPLAERLRLSIETNPRLAERVLCTEQLDDWDTHYRATYDDYDLALPGGETSRAAISRGAAAIEDILRDSDRSSVAVTHGNLLSLLLGHYGFHRGGSAGYDTWRALTNPDVFRLQRNGRRTTVERIWRP